MKTLVNTLTDTALMLASIAASALFTTGSAWADSERFTVGALSDAGVGIAAAPLMAAPGSLSDPGEAPRIDLFSAPIPLKLNWLGDEAKAAADIGPDSGCDAWRNRRPADRVGPPLTDAHGENDRPGIPELASFSGANSDLAEQLRHPGVSDFAGLSGEKHDTVVLVALTRHF
jgi:hypothetical protein